MQTPNHDACFFEQCLDTPLWRRSLTEALGTLLLTLSVVGTGAMLRQHVDLPAPLGALVASSAIAAALAGLVIALGPVSGGHFNPLITILQWISRERSLECTVHYCLAQFAGAVAGDAIGSMLWPLAHTDVGSGLVPRLFGSELLCAAALMVVVFACARSANRTTGPFAVAAWLSAAIIATPSGSLANPAIALGRLSDLGVSLATITRICWLIGAEVIGALAGFAVIALIYPRRPRMAGTAPVQLCGPEVQSD